MGGQSYEKWPAPVFSCLSLFFAIRYRACSEGLPFLDPFLFFGAWAFQDENNTYIEHAITKCKAKWLTT